MPATRRKCIVGYPTERKRPSADKVPCMAPDRSAAATTPSSRRIGSGMTRSGIVALVGAAMALVGYFLAARFAGAAMSAEEIEHSYEGECHSCRSAVPHKTRTAVTLQAQLMMLGISLFFAGSALVVIAGIAMAVLWLRARGAPRERSPRRR